ncbi:fumarylacetoacetate hydrolase family protein [Bacillus sp. CGMCC 1.16607]|uniref:fumarylacetoacetate hydrolase family protein n=1 Tax=Bacillus sp. CGMCC 1.16607 TaxID=3351842 RepID=UPI003637C0CA
MKFVTFENNEQKKRAGILVGTEYVVDVAIASNGVLPNNMLEIIESYETFLPILSVIENYTNQDKGVYSLSEVKLMAPLPNPRSFRDFYAFEQHVKTARSNRGLEMIPEWYEIPVFYFSNHLVMKGPEELIERPKQCYWLDYELEIACIIGKEGRDILRDQADDYIFGYCILNDWSARDLQRKEMLVGLGPAKGKDFATSIGPYILTKDELLDAISGKGFNINMTAKVNGVLLSEGNMKDLFYSFGEMIERASDGVTLFPGEIIGSGTVGSGCILELGQEVHSWLEPGDLVELEIEKLGVLRNKIAEG